MTDNRKGRLYYHRVPDEWSKELKLEFLRYSGLGTVGWERLIPNRKHTWLRSETEEEFDSFIPIGSKEAKRAKQGEVETIFKTYSRGISTSRDMVAYDYSYDALMSRMQQFVKDYNYEVYRYSIQEDKPDIDDFVDYKKIKWDIALKANLKRGNSGTFDLDNHRESIYRPFTKKRLYFDRLFVCAVYQQPYFFPDEKAEEENQAIIISDIAYRANSFSAIVTNMISDLHLNSSKDAHQCFPFYVYDEGGGNRRENVSDWALGRFRGHYGDGGIGKWDIFYYVYGMLHHGGYRERYGLDLKRSLPRVPLAPDFWAFAEAGARLADLHIHYESAERYPLDWHAVRNPPSYRVEKMLPKGKTAAADGDYKVYSAIKYNDSLTLHGIPERAFAYRLGNRSALDWVVDQYRVKVDKRSGIAHDPNGYSDDGQYILKLIERVITVSLRTVDVVEGLSGLGFGGA